MIRTHLRKSAVSIRTTWVLLLSIMLRTKFVNAQCVGVYNVTQLREAILSANRYNTDTPTRITLCSDFKLGSEPAIVVRPVVTSDDISIIFDLSDRNIQFRCDKTLPTTTIQKSSFVRQPSSRCVFDAEYTAKSIFFGKKTKLSVFGSNFINSGWQPQTSQGFIIHTTPYASGAWSFTDAKVILQQCSFMNNIGLAGGAIHVSGAESRLIIRTGTRVSQNLFFNNSASESGAIWVNVNKFFIHGRHTNFTNNKSWWGGAGVYVQSTHDSPRALVNISGAVFFNNLAQYKVRTQQLCTINKSSQLDVNHTSCIS
jgi:hypothetical protein